MPCCVRMTRSGRWWSCRWWVSTAAGTVDLTVPWPPARVDIARLRLGAVSGAPAAGGRLVLGRT
jgi:hypothetical protein